MDKRQDRWTAWLLISCFVVCLSASFMFGYGIGAPNQYSKFTEPFLKGLFHPCQTNDNKTKGHYNCQPNPTVKTQPVLKSSFVEELKNGIGQTLFVVGNFIGALAGPYWLKCSKFFDRRRIFYANYPFSFLFAIFIVSSFYGNHPSLFYISRLIHGFQGGMACTIVPPYLNEISPAGLRGKTGTFHQLFITIGILAGQVIGIPPLMGRYALWSWGMAIGSVTSLIALFVTPLICDSPSQMLNVMHNQEKAETALKKLTRQSEVSSGMTLLASEAASNNDASGSLSMKDVFTNPKYKWQLITTLTLMGVQAMSGINAVFFYSGKMFTVAGIPDEYLPYSTVCTGLINVLVTIAVLPLIDRFGRKPLIIYPMCCMIALFIGLTAVVEVNAVRNSPTLAWVAVVLVILFIVAFAAGLGPIPFVYACEVFRADARDAALSASLCVNYILNILLCLFFPAINAALRGYVFLIFAVIVAAGVVLLQFKMPETRNRTIDDIENEMRR